MAGACTSGSAARIAASGGLIVSSRMLALQSKRLLLAGAEHRLARERDRRIGKRAKRLREEIVVARHDYLAAVLTWGSPETAEYRLAAYGSLLDAGDRLSARLHAAVRELQSPACFEVETDIELLDRLIQRWRAAFRTSVSTLGGSTS